MLVLLALQGWPGVADGWRFDRARYEHGARYLLFTAQFVHLGWWHAGANALVLGGLTAGLARRRGLWTVLLLSGASIMGVAVVLALDGNCRYYAGASGWLHGLLAGGLWRSALSPVARPRGGAEHHETATERRVARVCLLLLAGKMGLEAWGLWPQDWGFAVYTPAHTAGVVGGSLAAWAWWLTAQKR